VKRVFILLIWIIVTGLALVEGCGGPGGGRAILPGLGKDKDEKYTIRLYVLPSSDHIERIKSFKAQTEQGTGWKGLFVERKEHYSELYWGRYATYSEAEKNLKRAREYRTPMGVAAYANARIVEYAGFDPGPSEWDLANAPGAYTVVVAVFYDVPADKYFGRKKYAVTYCEHLRSKSEEAYYWHGPARSTVTIGSFPETSVTMVDDGGLKRPDIRDPAIQAILDRYPYLAVNGYQELIWEVDPVTRRPRKEPARTYPAHIPRENSVKHRDALDSLGNTQYR